MSKNNQAAWEDLVTTKHAEILREYFTNRKEILDIENKELAESPSVDAGVKICSNTARIIEINQFLAKLEFHYKALSKKEA